MSSSTLDLDIEPGPEADEPTVAAGLAVALDVDVGLDVEAADRTVRGDPLRLAKRRFSSTEAASLEGG